MRQTDSDPGGAPAMTLNPKGLEAAEAEYRRKVEADELHPMRAAITAYLSASLPEDVAGLVKRLRAGTRDVVTGERLDSGTFAYVSLEDAEAAVAALTEAQHAKAGWRDIKDAPRDGTEFIAFENGDVYCCNWLEQDDGEGHFSEGWWDHVNQSFENPTHWMPLPASPASTEEAGS